MFFMVYRSILVVIDLCLLKEAVSFESYWLYAAEFALSLVIIACRYI